MTSDKPKAVIHVDLDGARHVFRHHGWKFDGETDPLFETGMANLLDFLQHNELRATLFVIAEQLDHPKQRALLQRAVAAGHEIASHTLTHPELKNLTPEQVREELTTSKQRLESELGVPVRGFRAPSYQINRSTFELLAEAGYTWDSSVFPDAKFAKRLGLLDIGAKPFRPLLDKDVLELPLPAAPGPVPFHPSYSILLGQWYFEWGLKKHRKTGAPLVMLLHLTDFANPLPDGSLTGLKSKLYTLSNKSAPDKRARVQKMLDAASAALRLHHHPRPGREPRRPAQAGARHLDDARDRRRPLRRPRLPRRGQRGAPRPRQVLDQVPAEAQHRVGGRHRRHRPARHHRRGGRRPAARQAVQALRAEPGRRHPRVPRPQRLRPPRQQAALPLVCLDPFARLQAGDRLPGGEVRHPPEPPLRGPPPVPRRVGLPHGTLRRRPGGHRRRRRRLRVGDDLQGPGRAPPAAAPDPLPSLLRPVLHRLHPGPGFPRQPPRGQDHRAQRLRQARPGALQEGASTHP